MKKQIIFFFLLVFSLNAVATNNERELKKTRTVCGKLTDATGEAVVGAAIKIVETGETIYTDMDGNYKLALPADQNLTLHINTIGFQPLQIQASELPSFSELTLKAL